MHARFLPPLLLTGLIALAGGCQNLNLRQLTPPPFREPAGKQPDRKQAMKALEQAYPCCSSYADFSYPRNIPDSPRPFQLGRNSPVANLGGKRTHFLAFRLPDEQKPPYDIVFKAEATGRWMSKSYIFAPSLTLLDAAFQPISSHDIKLCEYVGWSPRYSGAIGSFKVNTPQARYLLVHTSPAQLDATTYWEQSSANFGDDQSLSMSEDRSGFQIPHGPDGTVWIGLINSGYRYAIEHSLCQKPKEGNGLLHWP